MNRKSGKVDFSKKSKDIVRCGSESNGGIFDSLAPFGGELWRFETLKFEQHLQPTEKCFFEDFLSQ